MQPALLSGAMLGQLQDCLRVVIASLEKIGAVQRVKLQACCHKQDAQAAHRPITEKGPGEGDEGTVIGTERPPSWYIFEQLIRV